MNLIVQTTPKLLNYFCTGKPYQNIVHRVIFIHHLNELIHSLNFIFVKFQSICLCVTSILSNILRVKRNFYFKLEREEFI